MKPTPDQLKWTRLRKQGLLEEKPQDFYQFAEEQLGLHSADYWTPYLSAWARIGDYDARDVFESINSGHHLIRTHAFRTTVHVVHLDNLSVILSATGPSLYRRVCKGSSLRGLSQREIEKVESIVVDAFRGSMMTMREAKEALSEHKKHLRSIFRLLFAKGVLVRAKASHARSNLTSYALLEDWSPGFKLEWIQEDEAIAEVVRRHLERFGPATIDDVAWWLGTTKTAVKNAIRSFGNDIVSFEFHGMESFMEVQDYEIAGSLEAPSEPLVWFLPYEDHFLKAFIGRDSFISPDIQPKISPASPRHYWPSDPDAPRKMPTKGVRATGEVRPTIWLDGHVIGRWEIDDADEEKKIVRSLYSKTTKNHDEIVDEVQMQLEEFINDRLLPIS
jgi:hypothetical protein